MGVGGWGLGAGGGARGVKLAGGDGGMEVWVWGLEGWCWGL